MIDYPQILNASLTWEHFDRIDSTNSYLLAAEQPTNRLVSATQQTQGRGRRNKQWIDDGKSLLFSLSTEFDPKIDVSAWPIKVAITLTAALKKVANVPTQAKWPNDLYIINNQQQWGKFAGILIESSIGKKAKMITGVGMNMASIENIDADYPIGHFPLSIDKNDLLIFLANQLFSAWNDFLANPVVSPSEFMDIDYLRNKLFSAVDARTQETNRGLGLGITPQGHYQLRDNTKTILLTSQQHIKDIG